MDYPGKVITKTQVTPTQTSASGNWTLDDQAAAIKNNNWPVAGVPNPISKSLRFNSADSAYLNRTNGSPTSATTWTLSFWHKRSSGLGTQQNIMGAGQSSGTNYSAILFTSANQFEFDELASGVNLQLTPTQVFRDVSAWYHIIIAVDTTQATASNRIKLYVNGSQITAFTNATYPSQNYATYFNTNAYIKAIGNIWYNGGPGGFYTNGYMTEINFIDGQALTPSSFGMTNPQTGQWIPIKYSGTYGTNGFYLNFKDATSTTTLGYDYSGNANNWTTNNFSVTAGAGNDSLTDVPTPWVAYNTTGDVGGVVRGNYATLNPLDIRFGASSANTLANGNLQATAPAAQGVSQSSILFASGKWYFEMTVGSVSTSPASQYIAYRDAGGSAAYYAANGSVGGVSGSSGASYTTNDVIGLAVDKDAGTIEFFKNGTTQGGSRTITSNAAGDSYLQVSNYNGSVVHANFGQRPFAYTPPAGFRSLCTTNLPATTIGFGLTNQGDDYFNTVLYTGNGTAIGSGGKAVTGAGFQPDFVWIKSRTQGTTNYTGYHNLYDSVRGATKYLTSSTTEAESTLTQGLASFNSDGFTVGNVASSNYNGDNFVAWNWKAGGTGVTNTAGSITSTVSANTTAGFSVVTYTGTGVAATVGHGLGVAPSMIIVKDRDDAGTNWCVYHVSLGNGNRVLLNLTNASAATGNWNSTSPTSSVFSIGVSSEVSANNKQHVAYCFAAVAGYSAFGSFTGNGSTDGPFVYTGFRPRFVLYKSATEVTSWAILDTSRSTYNVADKYLNPNLSDAEGTFNLIDINSNGFKVRNSNAGNNLNGATYIFMAFAESPFQFSNAR